MGFCRVVDFSQFKVRGHYTHTERLGTLLPMRDVAGPDRCARGGRAVERCPVDVRFASPRETGLAIVLWHLLNQSGQFTTWLNLDRDHPNLRRVDRFADLRPTRRPAGGRGHPHAG